MAGNSLPLVSAVSILGNPVAGGGGGGGGVGRGEERHKLGKVYFTTVVV